jgi:RND family efflux transporter MFP subunit
MRRIEQIERLRLSAAVPESLAGQIAEGVEANFAVRSWPGRQFHGVIVRPSHTLDIRTRTMAVELDVDNSDHALAPGMYAGIAWPVRRTTPSLFVPQSAIVQTTERTFVVRVRNTVADPVAIRRGFVVGDIVEISGELAPGDLIVRRGNEELRTGTRVTAHAELPPDGGAGRGQ